MVNRPPQAGGQRLLFHALYAELAHREARLADAGRLRPRSQDVILVWDVIRRAYPLDRAEEAARRTGGERSAASLFIAGDEGGRAH